MQGKRDDTTKKTYCVKVMKEKELIMQLGWGRRRGWKQTDESLNIYCSNSYLYILVKNSISVGLFVFVYE